jgi:hypothetical protein
MRALFFGALTKKQFILKKVFCITENDDPAAISKIEEIFLQNKN